jgi:1-acyl-sn-glycerol-3-phosphate acyltransferase
MRSLAVVLTMLVVTPPLGTLAMIAAALGVRDRPGSVFWWVPHAWARSVLWAAGVRVRVHEAERMGDGTAPAIFVSNHVSWFDVFTLAATLPRAGFLSKAQILRIPVFGPGARALGSIPIERDNRKSAFASIEMAAQRIRAGASVVIFPEGTRGHDYALRPFKKGPFVMAIAAGAPIIPVIVHGTLPIMPKGTWAVRPGVVDMHFLEPVRTDGLTYEDRGALAQRVHDRMSEALVALYGVASDPPAVAPAAPSAALTFAPHG